MSRAFPLLLCLGLLAPLAAPAYEFIGPRWQTQDFPVAWDLDADGSRDLSTTADRQAVINAFNAWNAVGGTLARVAAPTSLAAGQQVAGDDDRNRVFWVECGPNERCWNYGQYTLGVTTPLYYTTGEMFDADIVFNGRDYVWTVGDGANSRYCRGGCTDVFSIALHEQGHFFGLDHPCEPTRNGTNCASIAEAEAVMFAAYPGFPKQALNSDDIAGIRALYPAPSPGSGLQGAGCIASGDCSQSPIPLICAQSTRSAICTKACTGTGDTSCPTNYACQPKSGGGFACLFASDVVGDLCKACVSGADCSNGLCIQLQQFSYCSRPCAQSGCPSGYQCASFEGSAETFCHPSADTCANNCGPGGACPTGLECRNTTCVYDAGAEGEACPLGLCETGLQCLGSSVRDALCYRSCNASTGAGCTTGYVCEAFGSQGLCVRAGTRTEGQSCAAATDCVSSLVCVPTSAGASGICRRRCATNGSILCPSGQTCEAVGGGGAACFENAPTSALCEACSGTTSPCSAGLICRFGEGGTLCRKQCTADSQCATGEACEQDGANSYCTCGGGTPTPDPTKQAEGESCAAEDECVAGLICIIDPRAVCRVVCTSDAVCGEGKTCQALGQARICRTAVVTPPPTLPCGCAAGGPVELLAGLGFLAAAGRRRRLRVAKS